MASDARRRAETVRAFNRVAVRAVGYGLSWMPLAIMIVRPLLVTA
jgi:hypothetical protein